MKEWLWIPAVVLVVLFILALCCLFFSDYTCCPCRRKRRPEPVLPTSVEHCMPTASEQEWVSPTLPSTTSVTPGSPSTLPWHYPVSLSSITRSAKPYTITPSVKPTLPQQHRITSSSVTPGAPVTLPRHHPSAAHYFALSQTDSPNLHLKFADLPKTQVLKTEHGVPVLDLHKMTVKEATQTTNNFINHSHGRYRKVRIVTGKGLHSEGGAPKIKPAIASMLKNANYKFQEVSDGGCFEVLLQ